MKVFKKALSVMLSLAVIATAMFAFTGCANKVKNKTYAAEDYTVVIVTASNGTEVLEQRSLTYREYFIFKMCNGGAGVALGDIASYTMSAEEEQQYNNLFGDMKENSSKLVFGKNEVSMISETESSVSGQKEISEKKGTYDIDKNVITLKFTTAVNEDLGTYDYVTSKVNVVDNKLEMKGWEMSSAYDHGTQSIDDTYEWAYGDIYYVVAHFSEVK